MPNFQTVDLVSYYNSSGIGDTISTAINPGPLKQPAILGVHDGMSNVHATGFTPDRYAGDPTEFTAVGVPDVFPPPISPSKIGLGPFGFTFSPVFVAPTVANNMTPPVNPGITVVDNMTPPINAGLSVTNNMTAPTNAPISSLGQHDGIPNIHATGFTWNTVHLGPSEFVGISGTPGAMTYSHTGNLYGIPGVHDSIPNIHANGFILNKVHLGPSDFVGISGGSTPGTFTYNHTGNSWGIPGIVDGILNIDARGFVPNKHHSSPSDFIGVSGDPGNMTFEFNEIGNQGGQIWSWNRSVYNTKISVGVDGFGNQKATGFTLGKLHNSPSNFVGIADAGGKFTYAYPGDISPFQSYAFTDSIYSSIIGNTKIPTAPGAKDGVGQSFDVRGKLIDGKKARLSGFGVQIKNLYTSIPGKGKTDLRRESHNAGFYGDQPYIMRDIGSNWSLFSDGPGPVHGDPFVRGGVGTALNRSLLDTLRIGKYLISSSGLLFIAKNIGMQLSNPRWQGATLLGLVSRTRVYPLGLSTLLQVPVNAFGIHFIRHGLGPLEGDGTYYEETVNEIGRTNYTKKKVYGLLRGKSRLYALGEEMGVGYFDKDTYSGKKPKKQGKGIFAKFGRWVKKQLKKLVSNREKIDTLSGLLGPHSVYGIGRTRIFRSNSGFGVGQHTNLTGTHGESKRLTTAWANTEDKGNKLLNADFPRAENPNFINNGYTPKEGNRYGDQIDDEGNFASEREADIPKMTPIAPDRDGRYSPSIRKSLHAKDYETGLSHRYESIAYGKIGKIQESGKKLNDFREYMFSNSEIDLDIAKRIMQQPNDGDDGEGPAWKGEDRITKFNENYGKVGKDVSNKYADLGLSHASVAAEETTGMPEPINALNTPKEDGGDVIRFDDLILFEFKTLQPKRNRIQLMATLTDFSDTLSPQFEEVGYVGRTSPTYLFKNITREASFSFKMYALTMAELDAQYKRLNRLMKIISPGFTSQGLPIGPIVQLTIGNYFRETPIIVDSFEISVPEQSPWDIDEGRQLPLYLDISVGIKVLFNEEENYDPLTGELDNASADEDIFSSTSNYFNAINANFGREIMEAAEEE